MPASYRSHRPPEREPEHVPEHGGACPSAGSRSVCVYKAVASRIGASILGAALALAGCERSPSRTPDTASSSPAAVELTPLPRSATLATDPDGASLEIGDTVGPVVFRTLTGARLNLQDANGAVLVNFWATDCVICLEEAPDLIALRDRLSNDGFEMISVAMPYDRPDAVLELATANGWTHPVAIDIDGKVLAAFEPIIGTPTNLLISEDGTLLERYIGRSDVDALERRVRAVLANES